MAMNPIFTKIQHCSQILDVIGNIAELTYTTGVSKLELYLYLIEEFNDKFQEIVDDIVELEPTYSNSSIDRFNIEEQVFACWNIIDDYKFILNNTKAIADHSYYLNKILPLYRLRFEVLLDQKNNFK
jgi:hypothetical protein